MSVLQSKIDAGQPPLQHQPAQLVILLGNKIIGLDSILPVAMELKAEAPGLDVRFLFMNRSAADEVKRNYILQTGMETIGTATFLSEGSGSLASKVAAGLRLLLWAAQVWLRPTILLSHSDLGVFPLNILAWMARRGGGGACTYCKTSYPGNPSLNRAQNAKTRGRDMLWRDAGDAFLVYHPTQVSDYERYSNASPALLSTPRALPAWRAFLGRVARTNGINDEQGRDLTGLSEQIFAIFYPGSWDIPHQFDNPRDSFLRALDTISAEATNAIVVIKPHSICDLDQLRRDIVRRDGLDVRISYAHPQLLVRIATVAIVTNATNVMCDCYIESRPVIETTQYRPDILALGDSLYPNRGRIGCPDEATLRAAIRDVVSVPEKLPKPDISDLVWPKPPSLSKVLWAT